MKKRPLYVIFQDKPSHSFWATNIHEGICDAARNFGDAICPLYLDSLPPDLKNNSVLLVGNSHRWLKNAIPIVVGHGAKPIIVNASMISDSSIRYSGVIFELEETLDRCLTLLKHEGRNRTVLLGLSPDSVTDQAKAKAFARPKDTVWASGTLEECVYHFADTLDKTDCDSVICANDTVAITLVRRLLQQNVSLPERLYIVGMGNSYLGAGLAVPLTSIMFDYREMGAEATKLYHRLKDGQTNSHITFSLPCHLVIRESAPLKMIPLDLYEKTEEPPARHYFNGEDTQNVIAVEALFQSGDAIDREILFGIARGESAEKLAEQLFFSDRAVRYRIAKLIKKTNYRDREELESALCRAMISKKGKNND